MICKEFSPVFILTPYIKSYIIIEDIEGTITNQQMSIYPSGHLEMIISYGDDVVLFSDDVHHLKNTSGYLGGQILKPIYYKCSGKMRIISVIFNPYGFYRFLNIPQIEFTHRKIDLDLVFGSGSRVFIDKLCEETNFEKKVDILNALFCSFLQKNIPDSITIYHAAKIIKDSAGKVNIKKLSYLLNKNIKTIERDFNRIVGLSPKEFSRVIRFNKAFNALNDGKYTNVQDIIFDFGYYDQSHFINEFKQFTGLNPSDFIKKEDNGIEYSFREKVKI